MNRIKEIGLVLILIAIFAIPRLAGLGAWTSIDEPFWLRQSANFYYALGQRDFENTVYEYHPAVTTMWIISGGMLLYFPEYRALGQGYLKPGKFATFFPEHDKDPLQLLIVSRTIQVAVIVILLILVYFLLRKLIDRQSAFFTTCLISLSPFFLGHSRLLNHEGMLSLFLLVSILSMLVYLYADQKLFFLFLSSLAGALGQLTKSSGLPLFPIIMLALVIHAFGIREKNLWRKTLDTVKALGIWLFMLAAAYVLCWPGMWVAPGKMLYEVYGNAFSYAFVGARMSVLPSLNSSMINFGDLKAGFTHNWNDLIWHTTPITWVGILLGIWQAVIYTKNKTDSNYRLLTLYSAILAVSFLVMFSALKYYNPPHYILTSYVALDLIAGLGWSYTIISSANRWPQLINRGSVRIMLGVLAILQLAGAASYYPYYITYANPVTKALESNTQNPVLDITGYGVGVDQAAAYLSQKADVNSMTVMSVHGLGSFSYYFPGTTVTINYFTSSVIDKEFLENLKLSQYVVIDYYNQKRTDNLALLDEIKPEKTIWIDGLEYLHIYRTTDLLARVEASQQP